MEEIANLIKYKKSKSETPVSLFLLFDYLSHEVLRVFFPFLMGSDLVFEISLIEVRTVVNAIDDHFLQII
jgi:hypothetical protein